ncbi:MAG: hypothetical protein JXA82_06565 [Sedimentisphaerales bacterium]|nr:hypothetical protein [Sedimentisphaerales bacterium]
MATAAASSRISRDGAEVASSRFIISGKTTCSPACSTTIINTSGQRERTISITLGNRIPCLNANKIITPFRATNRYDNGS